MPINRTQAPSPVAMTEDFSDLITNQTPAAAETPSLLQWVRNREMPATAPPSPSLGDLRR